MGRQGDGPAPLDLPDIAVLYQRYSHAVWQRCRLLLGNDDLAWDAMQNTFVRAIRYRASFRGDSQPLTWLFSIAFRVCQTERRRAVSTRSIDDQDRAALDVDPQSTSFEERLGQRRLVSRLLPRFKRRIQEVVVLRFFDDMEIRQISRVTGKSERTVLRRLSYFLERSRRLLGEATGG